MDSVFFSLDVSRISVPVCDVACSRCSSDLDLHQPDAELTHRILGTCPDCHSWFVIDLDTGLMILLPEGADLPDTPE
jgi:hypothetical protein